MKIKSRYTKEELSSRWDEFTSPARFAGSDDILDDIFIAKHKEDRVYLVRKPRLVYDLFGTVFRGKIKENETGSEIHGIFTVGIADYIIGAALGFAYGYIVYIMSTRSADSLKTVLLILLGAALEYAALRPKRNAKAKYLAFMKRISGESERN